MTCAFGHEPGPNLQTIASNTIQTTAVAKFAQQNAMNDALLPLFRSYESRCKIRDFRDFRDFRNLQGGAPHSEHGIRTLLGNFFAPNPRIASRTRPGT